MGRKAAGIDSVLAQQYTQPDRSPAYGGTKQYAGEPVEENNDLFGTALQMATRVCDSARPDQILAIESVQENHNGEAEPFAFISENHFKGFKEPAGLYEIPWQ